MMAGIRLERWERIAAGALALAAAGNLAAYLAAVQPLRAAQGSQQGRLLAVQRQVRHLQAEGRILEGQLETLAQVEAYREQLPERSRLVRLAGELTRLADGLSLKMPSVSYQPEPVRDVDLLRVKLTLAVEGPYGQVRRFLHELERRRGFLVVERMALAEQRAEAASGRVAMQLGLAGYFR